MRKGAEKFINSRQIMTIHPPRANSQVTVVSVAAAAASFSHKNLHLSLSHSDAPQLV